MIVMTHPYTPWGHMRLIWSKEKKIILWLDFFLLIILSACQCALEQFLTTLFVRVMGIHFIDCHKRVTHYFIQYDREFSDDEEIDISTLEDVKINGIGKNRINKCMD